MGSSVHIAAAQSLVDPALRASPRYKALLIRADREKVHPDILRFHARFQKELGVRQYPFFVTEFYRSPERQNDLLAKGVSRASAGRSPHQHGMAMDLVHASKLWEIPRAEWAIIGALGKETARKMSIPIVWGGDFKTIWDPAHWELAHWKALVDIGSRVSSEPNAPDRLSEAWFALTDARYRAAKKSRA